MIKLPDFSKCVEFKVLRQKMGVIVIPELPMVEFQREVIEKKVTTVPNPRYKIEQSLRFGNIDVSLSEIDSDQNGLLELNGRKVVAYIRDQRQGVDTYSKYSEYKYHLCDCKTLKHMRSIGRERRYLSTKRTDGYFEVNDLSGYAARRVDVRLDLCWNCKQELKLLGIYSEPFYLQGYFEKNDTFVPETIRRIEQVKKVQTYTPEHDDIAREYKKTSNYECQFCGVSCLSNKELLHLHHMNGDPSDNTHSNLRVYCIDCHSKQPQHSQVGTTERSKMQIEMIKNLRKEQGITDLEIVL